MFAALGAVLGKQWLSHYGSVGGRGTVEKRGIGRQLKVNGLQAWHFRTILEFISVLIQASLLLFSIGLSAYVYNQQRIVAAVVIVVNGFGAVLYFSVIAFSLLFPDSPFYTSLSAVLQQLINPYIRHLEAHIVVAANVKIFGFSHLAQRVKALARRLRAMYCFLSRGARVAYRDEENVALSTLGTQSVMDLPLEGFPVTKVSEADSAAGFAIGWIHETTTDPFIFVDAMRLLPDIQWSLDTLHALPIDILDRILLQIDACFQPDPHTPGALALAKSHEDTAALLTSAYLFVYWEKFAAEQGNVQQWSATLGPPYVEDSHLDYALHRLGAGHEEEGKSFDLRRWTLYHSEFLRGHTSKLISRPLLSFRYQTMTGSETLRIRTTFYLAQQAACRMSTGAEDLWDLRRDCLELIRRQSDGVSSPDSLVMAILACAVVVTCELPQSLVDAVTGHQR